MKLLLYDPNNHLADWKADSEFEPLVIRSPSGRFEIRYQVGRCHPPGKNGLDFGKAEIYDVEKKSLEAILVRDHYTEPAFDWVTRDGNCILIWASTYLKGFEVIDLNQKSLKHVEIAEDEEFIWLDCKTSPNQTKIAVSGCYWACPYELKVLDLANLENADLEKTGLDELATFSMEETDSKIAWADDQTVVTLKDEQETSRNSV